MAENNPEDPFSELIMTTTVAPPQRAETTQINQKTEDGRRANAPAFTGNGPIQLPTSHKPHGQCCHFPRKESIGFDASATPRKTTLPQSRSASPEVLSAHLPSPMYVKDQSSPKLRAALATIGFGAVRSRIRSSASIIASRNFVT
jgi:hypothetical protein